MGIVFSFFLFSVSIDVLIHKLMLLMGSEVSKVHHSPIVKLCRERKS